jgi:hypothetical protein
VSSYQHFRLVDLVLVFLIAHGHQSVSNINLSFYKRDSSPHPSGLSENASAKSNPTLWMKNLLLTLVQAAIMNP